MANKTQTEPSVTLPDVGRRLAVLCDASSVSIVGAEGAVRIRFEADGASGRLISTGTGGDVLVAEGPTGQIIDMFARLRSEAVPARRGRGLTTLSSGVAAAALVLVGLGGGYFANRATQAPAFDGVALQRALSASQGARMGAPSPEAVAGAHAALPRSVPMPAELPSLDDAPASKPAPTASVAPSVPARKPTPVAKAAEAIPAPAAAPATAAPATAAPAAAAGAPAEVAAKPPAPVVEEAKAVDAKPAEAAPTADAKPSKSERTLSGPEAISAAIARMNPYEAQRAVKTLDDIKTSLSDTGEISPELLREIPHEIAMALRDAGVNLTPGERREAGRKSAAVVRLPSSAIETFRGRDGIASIPDSNSWVLTDGNVRLPLPGGGDIRTVESMTEFGLQP